MIYTRVNNNSYDCLSMKLTLHNKILQQIPCTETNSDNNDKNLENNIMSTELSHHASFH